MQAKISISLPTIPLIICFGSGIFLATTEYVYCLAMSVGSVVIYLLYFFTKRTWLLLLMIAFVSFCVPVQVVCTAIFAFKTVVSNEVRICGKLPNCTQRCNGFQGQCRMQTQYETNWWFFCLAVIYALSIIVLLRCLYKLCEALKQKMILQRGTDDELNEPPCQTQEYEIQPILVNGRSGETNMQMLSESSSTNTMILQPPILLPPSKLPLPQIILIEAEKLPNYIATPTILNRILEAPPPYSDVIRSIST